MPRFTGFASVPISGPAALPVIGVHANALRLFTDPIGRMMMLQRRFGNIVANSHGSPALVCAFGAECNREVLSNPALYANDEFFVKLPAGSALAHLARGLVFENGATHQRHRRVMMPAFRKSAIDGYATDVMTLADASLRSWPIGRPVDVTALLRDMIQQIALRCLFGMEFEERHLGPLVTRFLALLTSPWNLILPWNLPGAPFTRLLSHSETLLAALRQLVADKQLQSSPGRDALALMLAARDEPDAALTDEEVIGEAMTLFVAGHETQARTLAWTLFLLEQHPHVLAELVEENTSVLRGAPPSADDVSNMPLLDRVVKESMRILPAAPVLFIRVCQSEARLGPVTLPRGASVVTSPFMTHHDPERYPEPARFRPERWQQLRPNAYEYLPFGAGPRMCIGASFAAMTVRLVLALILQRYRMTLASEAQVSRSVRGNILSPKYGLPMLIYPQDRRFTRTPNVRGDIHELVELEPRRH